LTPSQISPLFRSRKLEASVTTVLLSKLHPQPNQPVRLRIEAASIEGNYRVVEGVIDGDTLLLDNGERVRLIGVDTPETKHPSKPVEHFGKEAAAFTRRMVEGKRVRLEFDLANAPRAHKDSTQQRHTLAYVSLDDGTLLNAEIIKQGYGLRLYTLSLCAAGGVSTATA
jgi:endonuclease YncB( thermonuclease family)